MRARGLKHRLYRQDAERHMSRPMRARGLKHALVTDHLTGQTSRPMRARGLKPVIPLTVVEPSAVAPHAGAWIETFFILE